MSHHGDRPFDEMSEEMRKLLQQQVSEEMPAFQKKNELHRKLLDATGFKGALGDFPQGKLNSDDEGAIQFAIGESEGKVVIDFGTSVHWVGMTPQQAADFASAILKKARAAGRKAGASISYTI